MGVLLIDGLLNEYILANESWQKFTGGSKCTWDPKNSKFKFRINRFYYICIFLFLLFGIPSYYNSFMVAFGVSEHQEFHSIAVNTLAGSFAAHFSTWSYLKCRNLFGEIFNNILLLDRQIKGK